MYEACVDGIIYQFENKEDLDKWILERDSSDIITIIDSVEVEPTVRYSDRPICDHCNNGPLIDGKCPVCNSAMEYFSNYF